MHDVLGADLTGAYLYGSAVLGGLRPRSDIDVLVVARRPTTREEKRRLVDRLLAISGRDAPGRPARPVDLTIVVESEIRLWRVPPAAMVLLANRPLLGPPPAEVFDPVPRGDYVSAMVRANDPLVRDLEWDTRNAVLTLARIWSTLATGIVRSKDDAADWALARLPEEHRDVLARARAAYRGEAEERWEDLKPRVRPYVDYVVGEIERLAPDAER